MRLLLASSVLRRWAAIFTAVLFFGPSEAAAQDFVVGNIVVARVGDGSAALSGSTSPVFLDEYTTAGVFVRTVPLPTTTVGANRRLTLPGSIPSSGSLALSTDRRYLTLGGYDAAVGNPGANGSSAATIPRVVAVVDGAATVNTAKFLTDWADAGTVRGVVADDAGHLWLSGSTGGMRGAVAYAGTSTSWDVSDAMQAKNLRVPGLFDGNLFTTSASGTTRLAVLSDAFSIGGSLVSNLPGFPTTGSPYGFFFADLTTLVAGVDTVYVADDVGGVQKYCLSDTGTWSAFGSVGAGGSYRNMTGKVNGSTVTLYVTRNNDTELAAVQDLAGYGSSVPMTASLLATAPANTRFSGVAFAPAAEMVTNGALETTTNWTLYATPNLSYMPSRTTSGFFEYYRLSPPPGTTNQAVIYQETGKAVKANSEIVARFIAGNSSTVRKRLSVLILNSNFSDLSVCTFWLPPDGNRWLYEMQTHSTTAWSNAAIYFYAASTESWGGYYQLSNVTMANASMAPFNGTQCIDGKIAHYDGNPAGPNLLTNGDFGTGQLTPWGTFGTITTQVTGGVLELIKPSTTPPAGVVLQATGQAMVNHQILTANFQLGNSSSVRKRVTVLLHDNNFTDLSACTFWLPPSTPLANYAMKTMTTRAWTNATLSVYPATAGADPWIRLDNVTLQRGTGYAMGTECMENLSVAARPAGTSGSTSTLTVTPGPGNVRTALEKAASTQEPADAGAGELSTPEEWLSLPRGVFVAVASESGDVVLPWEQTVEAAGDEHAWLRFDSVLGSRGSWGEVLMRRGDEWVSVHALRADGGTGPVEIALGAPAGDRVELQFVFHGVSAADDPADLWRIADVTVSVEP